MEESIGYEALYSAEEWDSLDIGEWSLSDEEPELQDADPDATHSVRIYEVGEVFETECELCGDIGSASSEQEAQAIARLHEAFVATLAENWMVER